jgi:hypothetical protein
MEITPGIRTVQDIGPKPPAHPIRYCQAMVLCPVTMVRRAYWEGFGTAYLIYFKGGLGHTGMYGPLPTSQASGGAADPKRFGTWDYWVCVPVEYFEEPANEWGEIAP